MSTQSPALFAIIGLVVILLAGVALLVSRYSVATPDQAFVITGRKGKGSGDLSGQKVVTGGGVFVLPLVQRKSVLDLSSQNITVKVGEAPSLQGIRLTVEAVALVKVGGDEDSIRAAAQRFPGDTAAKINVSTTEVLSGVLRSAVGTMTVQEIMQDRAAFASRVAAETEAGLTGQGLILDTFQIKEVNDDGTYLRDMARPEAARVEQEAKIAEADATRTAEQRRLNAQADILQSQRDFDLKQAEIQTEVAAQKAKAEAAGPIAQAAEQQRVLAAEELVAQRQAALTERQLDTQVRKPADAARYKANQEAEARKEAEVLEAQAKLERTKLEGEGELARRTSLANAQLVEAQKSAEAVKASGEGEKASRVALADATKVEGEAQAASILEVGKAEGLAMDAKAEALKNYGDAAKLNLIVEVLPKIAHEMAAPMGAIDSMTVISNEGASALPKAVSSNMLQVQQLLQDTLGIDLAGLLGGGTIASGPSSLSSVFDDDDKVATDKAPAAIGN